MKNFIIGILVIAVVSGFLQLVFPWWVVVVVAFATGHYLQQSNMASFFAGFIAIALLWIAYAWVLSSANDNLLAGKVAELLKPLTGGKQIVLYLITGLSGGVVAGFSCLTGRLASVAFSK